jgi:hypothetical protein
VNTAKVADSKLLKTLTDELESQRIIPNLSIKEEKRLSTEAPKRTHKVVLE